MTDEKSALIGKRLGDYELRELIAAGGMARIYKGIDTRLQRAAAVKVLMRELMESDETLSDRFTREAQAVAQMDHENIIRLYQYGEQDGYYFLAMKYIDGHDLADELARLRRLNQSMNIRRALNILGQVASALDYAHTFDIIHRDVKPSNILLDRDDKAILTDFGLVLWQSKDKTMGTAFGTPRYISPEQALASEKAVPQSDVYSLAVVLYEILTGDMLFRAETPMQIALSHISEPPPPPRSVNPDIPEEVEKALLRALDKDPRKRFHTACDFINAVRLGYGDALDRMDGVTPSAISPSKTPVLDDEADQQRRALIVEQEKARANRIPAAAPDDDIDTQAGYVRPDEAAKAAAGSSASKRRAPAWMVAASVMTLLIVGGVVMVSANGFSLSTATGNGGGSSTDQPTSAAVGADATATPASATETPLPALAVVENGLPLVISYDPSILVIRNPNDAALNLAGIGLGRPDANSVYIEASLSGRTRFSPGGCIVLIRQGSEPDFRAGDWGCVDSRGGLIHDQRGLPQESAFWRQQSTGTLFEIRHHDAVIARCDTVARGAERTTCEVTWPVE
jgi:tRNA A-37 threonylcarbamoyl transferase component Bud32